MVTKSRAISERRKEEKRLRQLQLPSQLVPVPHERLLELREKGWFDASRAQGLVVEVEEDLSESYSIRWSQVKLSGAREDDVRAGALRIMSAIVPPRQSL